MVPNGWEKHAVGKLCRSIVPGRNKPKTFDGTIPWVTTPEISGKYIPSIKQRNYISKNVANECGAKIVPAGAVVIAAVGELGLTAIAKQDVILNQQLHAFVCPENVNNEFLAYFLSVQKPYMDTVASKTTIPYMNKSNCESIPILLPPLPEQRKIAKILSTWDKAITTTEKLIATSQQQKKALMQQLLTGKKRLFNSETGKAFEGDWEDKCLSKLTTLITNGFVGTATPFYTDESGVPYLYGLNVKNNKLNYKGLRYVTNEFHAKQLKSQLTKGDLLMVQSGHIGETAVVTKEFENSNCHALIVIKPQRQKVYPDYLSYYFNSEYGKYRLKCLEVGSTIMHINTKDMKTFSIPLPPINEQQKIASVLTTADKEIELLDAKLAHLKQEKKALMQQLLTGKRRVKLDKSEAA